MSDFLELALKRQSCRSFNKEVIEHDKLLKIVEAGRLSPSGCNSQPWEFIVVESKDKVKEVALTGQQLGINSFLDNAGAFIIVLEKYAKLMPGIRKLVDSQYFAQSDLGGSIVSMCYEASSLNVGTCIIGMYDRTALSKILGLDPEVTRYAGFIALGYPTDDEIRTKQRKSLKDIVRFI
jgi:nitroreductase